MESLKRRCGFDKFLGMYIFLGNHRFLKKDISTRWVTAGKEISHEQTYIY